MAGLASSRAAISGRKKWKRILQLAVILVVLGEMAFILRLDRLNGHYFSLITLASMNSSLFFPNSVREETGLESLGDDAFDRHLPGSLSEVKRNVQSVVYKSSCEEWLAKADNLPTGRNFSTQPIHVAYGESQVWDKCSVGCIFKSSLSDNIKADGLLRPVTGLPNWLEKGAAHILRSMESSSYYPENNRDSAHRRGYDVVMTTSLASDVPVGYFSWAEYDIMAPVARKTEAGMAAAFISNCGAHNFRLDALEELKRQKVTIDSYGQCLRTHEGRGVDKLETLKRYKFSLAFENSNEDDYVTEKFWQSLVAGSMPVVVGAPNIQNFAPAPNALLHISSLDDVPAVARQMRYLASNFTAYNETLRWKYDGPSDGFKALVDMAAVHSSCRLCIHLATNTRSREEKELKATSKRPCKCTDKAGIVTYHLYVRERGRYDLHSIFMRSDDLTASGLQLAVLGKFKSLNHEPIWWHERPPIIRGDGTLKLYKLYPVGLNQRDALYSSHLNTDTDVKSFLETTKCPKLEAVFV